MKFRLESEGLLIMRIGVLTSTETRHRFVARYLARRLNVVAVGYEQTGYSPAAVHHDDLTEREREIVAFHFAERVRQEERFFGHEAEPFDKNSGMRVLHIGSGTLNSPSTLQFLRAAEIEAVVVYGTNLIKQPLIDAYAGRMINMHLGLSPYYRGTATNFYPLLNEEPEYVGATIHLIDPGIDSGPICKHARPTITPDDQPHTIGCKAILAGVEALVEVVQRLLAGRLHPTPQWRVPHPRLYLRKDYHPRQVVELYRKLEAGLIRRYLERLKAGEAKIRLIG